MKKVSSYDLSLGGSDEKNKKEVVKFENQKIATKAIVRTKKGRVVKKPIRLELIKLLFLLFILKFC